MGMGGVIHLGAGHTLLCPKSFGSSRAAGQPGGRKASLCWDSASVVLSSLWLKFYGKKKNSVNKNPKKPIECLGKGLGMG